MRSIFDRIHTIFPVLRYQDDDAWPGPIWSFQNTENYSKWISYIEDRPFNDKRYYISNQKLRDLGWNIDISLEDGLDLLINDI